MTDLAVIAKAAEKSKLLEYLERKLEQVTKPNSAEDMLRFLQEIDIVIKSTDGKLSNQDIPLGLLTRLLYKVSVTAEYSNPAQQHFHDKLHSILCDSNPPFMELEYMAQHSALTQKLFGPKQRSEIALTLEKLTSKTTSLTFNEVQSLVQKLRIAKKLNMRSEEEAIRILMQVGNKFHTFLSEISTMPQRDREVLTFNTLVPMLQEHALEAAQARPPAAQAHAISAPPPTHAHAPTQDVDQCARCHRPGHSTKVCRTPWCSSCHNAHGAHITCKGTKNNVAPTGKGFAAIVSTKSPATGKTHVWAYDSAASHHLTGNLALITDPEKLITPIAVNTASGQRIMATHRGMSSLMVQRGDETVVIPLHDVLYCKELVLNLLTDKTQQTQEWTFTIGPKARTIAIPTGIHNPLGETILVDLVVGPDNLTYVSNKFSCVSTVSVSPTTALALLHNRLGHLNYDDLAKLCKLTGTKLSSKEKCFCDSCAVAKSRRASVPTKAAPRNTIPGEIIHCDILGPNHDAGLTTHKFFLLMVDDATRYNFLYPMAKKSDATEMLKRFVAEATQLNILGPLPTDGTAPKPRTLQTDNDSVLVKDTKFVQELARHHIKWRASPPYTQEKNGVAAEREPY